MSSSKASPFQPFPEYRPDPGFRDEAVGADGTNSAWVDLFESCRRHGKGVLKQWHLEAVRLSRERGLAYHVDVAGSAGWSLDPIPWILSAGEWNPVNAGIAQRTRLFEAVLRDLYGQQKTLKDGLIPPRMVLSHAGFVRSLRGSLDGQSFPGLGIGGFDLARVKNGNWVVLNDRFDSEFGLGLALENRTVVNQVLPNLFRRCQVRFIGHFFKDWFHHLADWSANSTANPRVVILDSNIEESPESDFLSNYCKIPRVTASDLTVRSGAVWLKALNGLEPVHAIWKRDAGSRIDPLGIPAATHGGLAGLFESMRLGNVAVASHPGVRVLESPGLYPFTANLCRELLGEEILIPNVQSWWGGDPESLTFLLEHLPRLVIKKVDYDSSFETHYGRLCSAEQIAELRSRIRQQPEQFIGQEELDISTVPTSNTERLFPHRAVLRGFSFPGGDGNPRVMPGGLGRVSREDGSIVSTRTGGMSKDIWIRSNVLEEPISIAEEVEQSRIRVREVVTSRSGENLFWAGRYAERTDFVSRFAMRLIESSVIGVSFGRKLEKENETVLLEGFFELFELTDWIRERSGFEDRIELLLTHRSCPASIALNLESFHRACVGAHEKWSRRSLHAIRKIREEWRDETTELESPIQFRPHLERLELNLAAFVGLNLDSMTRDAGWALLDSGRALERSQILAGLAALLFKTDLSRSAETLLCESILVTTDSLRTYQSRFLSAPKKPLTLRLLLDGDDYPKSLSYLVMRMRTNLQKLPAEESRDRVLEQVDQVRESLDQFLDNLESSISLSSLMEISEALQMLSDELTQLYFSHASD